MFAFSYNDKNKGVNEMKSSILKDVNNSNILAKITDIYIFIIILLFPLMVDKTGFFKILECKYRCFVGISIIYILSITIIFIV